MIRTFAKMYEGAAVRRAGKVIDFDWPFTGTLKRFRIKGRVSTGVFGSWYLNLRNNGTYVLPATTSGMLKFTNGDVDEQSTGLDVAVVEGQPASLNVVYAGNGQILAPLILICEVDDGKNPYTLASETEVEYDNTLLAAEVVFTGEEIGAAYIVGSRVRVINNLDPADFVEGVITDIDNQDFTVLIDRVEGTGTSADWSFTLTGEKGEQGVQGIQGIQGVPGDDGNDGAPGADGADGVVQSIVAGTGIDIDDTDPANPIVSALGGGGGGVQVDVFTDPLLNPHTWTKHADAETVQVIMWGGGGSGGSGGKNNTGGSGGGGGGGAYIDVMFKASDLGATEDVVVGAGGTGPAGVSTNATNGTVGVAGGNSIFGNNLVVAGGGGGGGPGTANAAVKGGAGGGMTRGTAVGAVGQNGSTGTPINGGGYGGGDGSTNFPYIPETGGAGSAGGGPRSAYKGGAAGGSGIGNGAGGNGGQSVYGGPGGGGGGGASSAPAGGNGGAAGLVGASTYLASAVGLGGGTAGGAGSNTLAGTNGSDGAAAAHAFSAGNGGGGGGGTGGGFAAGRGGHGSAPGGGGGGGGACWSTAGASSGAGGNGGNGKVIVIQYLG